MSVLFDQESYGLRQPVVRGSNRCELCQSNGCPSLTSIPLEGGKYRRLVCNRCIASTTHPFIQKALKERRIEASKVLAARVGGGCPQPCAQGAAVGCLVATRAASLAELHDAL
jgi:hypothetical protein